MDDILLNNGLLGNASTNKKKQNSRSGMFIFNGYNLHNGTSRRVINSNHDDLGSIAFSTFDYPRSDGGNALSKFYRKKTINISLSMVAPDEAGLNDLIDELKFQTSKTQGFLDIIINGIVRRREATLVSLKFGRQSYNVNRLQNVQLTFDCVNPLSFSLSSISNTFSGISGNYSLELNYTGKVISYPTIYLIIQSESNLSGITIDCNGYNFALSHAFQPSDIVIIDGTSKLAKVNGTTIPYDGPFPTIEPGLNHIDVKLNTGSIANYDIIFIYKKLYL